MQLAQAITDITGRIIHLDSCQAYRHDMRLLRD
ncbi:Uncharacterised protein [Chlamydia trachomatis]|nr:Uncharacterised protein [Chlamydia trachomatis]